MPDDEEEEVVLVVDDLRPAGLGTGLGNGAILKKKSKVCIITLYKYVAICCYSDKYKVVSITVPIGKIVCEK